MKLGVASPAGVWAVVVVVLLGLGVEQPPGTEGAAAPHGCCRRGRFAAVALGFIGVSDSTSKFLGEKKIGLMELFTATS